MTIYRETYTTDGWEDGREKLLDLLRAGHYSQRGAARELDISERAMRYYCAGEQPVPRVVLLALEHLAACTSTGAARRARQARTRKE
jgi:hypothetical protein